MIIGTRAEFEALADYILRDYLGENYDRPVPVRIEDFAVRYLRMKLVYVKFGDSDGIVGMRQHNYIILNKKLARKELTGMRNFTVAHECAHEVINWQEDTYNPIQMPDFRVSVCPGRPDLTERIREWQANTVAAYLLMRPALVEWGVYAFCSKRRISLYGNRLLSKDDYCGIAELARFLGVSREALLIRMRQTGLLRVRPMEEYDPISDIALDWRWFCRAEKNRIGSGVYPKDPEGTDTFGQTDRGDAGTENPLRLLFLSNH